MCGNTKPVISALLLIFLVFGCSEQEADINNRDQIIKQAPNQKTEPLLGDKVLLDCGLFQDFDYNGKKQAEAIITIKDSNRISGEVSFPDLIGIFSKEQGKNRFLFDYIISDSKLVITHKLHIELEEGVTRSEVSPLLDQWFSSVDNKWDGHKLLLSDELSIELDFEVESVEKEESLVTVSIGQEARREVLNAWNLFTTGETVAHEIGHHVCLPDEYVKSEFGLVRDHEILGDPNGIMYSSFADPLPQHLVIFEQLLAFITGKRTRAQQSAIELQDMLGTPKTTSSEALSELDSFQLGDSRLYLLKYNRGRDLTLKNLTEMFEDGSVVNEDGDFILNYDRLQFSPNEINKNLGEGEQIGGWLASSSFGVSGYSLNKARELNILEIKTSEEGKVSLNRLESLEKTQNDVESILSERSMKSVSFEEAIQLIDSLPGNNDTSFFTPFFLDRNFDEKIDSSELTLANLYKLYGDL